MTYFLEYLAKHISENYGDRLEKQCLVFPNRRAGFYFMKYLSGIIDKPVWSPAVKTINELFSYLSPLEIAENETLIIELYKIYRELSEKLKKKPEPFDEFYFWGEMLLNDFDDVDKYLADAGKLFSNLSDLKRIDSEFGELTDEQKEIIRQFWVNFNDGRLTEQKEMFIELWTILPEIYTGFRKRLRDRKLAYEGMIFRDVAEKCLSDKNLNLQWETFHFVGFNALNKCEKVLFRYLSSNGKAKFYWDYDESYIDKSSVHTAGYFIMENLQNFGNDMPDDWSYRTLLSSPAGKVKRKIISTSTDITQVKLVPELLKGFGELKCDEAHHTAIILADENLLLPLLSSVPETAGDVNMTMGYPLKFSPVYSFLRLLLLLQRNCRKENDTLFEYPVVSGLLQHSFLSDESKYNGREILNALISAGKRWIPASELCRNESLGMIFRKVESPAELASYIKNILGSFYFTGDDETTLSIRQRLHNEFIFRVLQVVNRLENITGSSEIAMKTETWSLLLDRILRNISVPFSGEPLSGIQIMGLLETRTLDFKNIIMLSVNEGVLPRSSAGSSYIPYSLREAFGLPVIKHQDSIYSYYFYRLLHRAENVVFVYNSNAEGLKTGEMSRFLMQLIYLYETPPAIINTGYKIGVKELPAETIERSGKHSEILEKIYFGKNREPLSPNAINTWTSCRMKFYYRYVCGLKEPEGIITGIDSAVFGEILHQIMKDLYSGYIGKTITSAEIKKLTENHDIEESVKKLLRLKFHSDPDAGLSGSELIAASILNYYIRLILGTDLKEAPFEITGLEQKLSIPFEIDYNGRKEEISIGGIIDRIDKKSGNYRIIDYKTGSIKEAGIESIASLFDESKENRGGEWLQVLIYCEIFFRNYNRKVFPLIYSLRKLTDTEYTGMLTIKNKEQKTELIVDDYSKFREEFCSNLKNSVNTIFDKNEPFMMTENKKNCEYCPYIKLCNR